MLVELRAEVDWCVIEMIQRLQLYSRGFIVLVNRKRAMNTDIIHKGDLIVIIPVIKGGKYKI